MRALTLTQPSAYLAGVVAGDGWCTRTLGLRVADEDFARAFSWAVRKIAPEVLARVARDERGYWLVRASNKTGRWDYLRDLDVRGTPAMRAWLLGLFDSEGNASLRLNGVSENSYGRRVAIYSTNHATLERAEMYLADLGIPTRWSVVRPSAGHKGAKTVYELAVCGSRASYGRFATFVGSSIRRKQEILEAIPDSYRPDTASHCRAGQAKGVATRRARRDAGGVY